MARTAVMLMAYGSPASQEDIPAYLAHIRGGKTPTQEQVAGLVRRYDAIGGRSPLPEITRCQAVELERSLWHEDIEADVLVSMKHSPPFVSEVAEQAVRGGARRLLGLALAPHYSKMSIGAYERELLNGVHAAGGGAEVRMVREFHLHPKLISLWAGAIAALRRGRPEFARPECAVLYSAHSLPASILAQGDPYADQVHATCVAVSKALGNPRWSFAWQSAPAPSGWLGPPIEKILESLASGGASGVLSAPIGFTSDHLETLYDLDVATRAQAEKLGLAFARVAAPNATPGFVELLVSIVKEHLEAADALTPAAAP